MGQEGVSCIEIAWKLCIKEFRRFEDQVSDIQWGDKTVPLLIKEVVQKDGTAVERSNTYYIRLSRDFENSIRESSDSILIRRLKEVFEEACQSMEFFVSHSTELWVKTIFVYNKGGRPSLSQLSSVDLTIQSNVVPCRPHWEKFHHARKNHAADSTTTGVYFPSTYLERIDPKLAAHFENNREVAIQKEVGICELMMQTDPQEENMKPLPFWKIEEVDVEPDGLNSEVGGSDGKVERMLWRGGRFVCKKFTEGEFKVLRQIGSHPHIVHSFGVSIPENKSSGDLKYWMEHMNNNLREFLELLKNNGEMWKDPKDYMSILLQIAKAMKHLHDQNVVHGDLKADNVLISQCEVLGDDKHYIVKLADFDRSCLVPSKDEDKVELVKGTRGYVPPEFSGADRIRVTASDAKKSEVYTFGVLAFEVLTGEDCESDIRDKSAILAFFTDSRESYTEDMIHLIDSCLNETPSARPSFADVTETLVRYVAKV